MNVIDRITAKQIRTDLPEFRVGDEVSVGVKIIEGNKERVQAFDGLVIAIQGSGISKTFTVRKISSGVGVERTFPYSSPNIASLKVVRKNLARRAKIGGYLRKSVKQPKLKERK